MSITGLDITTNTEEGRLANEHGELTTQQREWLVNQLKKPYQPPGSFASKNVKFTKQVLAIMMVITTLVVAEVSASILARLSGSSWIAPVLLINAFHILFYVLLYIIFIAYWPAIKRLWKRLRYITRIGPHLWEARRKLATGDYQIESWDGPVRFETYPAYGFEMFGTTSPEATYVLQTQSHTFPVSKALWEALRLNARQDFSLHYLTEPYVTLLSVVPMLRSEPPTDAELASVIGISDDGELIYEEQNQQARSKA